MVRTKKYLLCLIGCLAVGLSMDGARPAVQPKPALKKSEANKPQVKPQNSNQGLVNINNSQEFNNTLNNGRPTVIFFHSLTCPHCTAMKPIVVELAKKHGGRVNIVSLEASNKSLNAIFDKYNIEGYPTFVFVDSARKERKREMGELSKSNFDKKIAELK